MRLSVTLESRGQRLVCLMFVDLTKVSPLEILDHSSSVDSRGSIVENCGSKQRDVNEKLNKTLDLCQDQVVKCVTYTIEPILKLRILL